MSRSWLILLAIALATIGAYRLLEGPSAHRDGVAGLEIEVAEPPAQGVELA